ncbi:MAG: hypothetical protein ACRD19_03115 [Terriglobia bacterium]
MKKFVLAAFLTIGMAAGIYAQAGPPPGGHFHGRAFARGFGMHAWKVVTGAPYSATLTQQFTRTLANGTTISHTTTGQVARDSAGRTYQQQTIGANGQNTPRTFIFITDPVAGYAYALNPAKHTAIRRPFHAHQSNNRPRHFRRRRQNGNETVNDLGTQADASSGLELQGKQVTRTIPADSIGNSQTITSVRQTWYSPALQIVVHSTSNDPRFGQSTYTLSNISQSEPDPSLFTVPAGYTIKDARHGPGVFGAPPQ